MYVTITLSPDLSWISGLVEYLIGAIRRYNTLDADSHDDANHISYTYHDEDIAENNSLHDEQQHKSDKERIVKVTSKTHNRYHGRPKDPTSLDITTTRSKPDDKCISITTTKFISNIYTQNVHGLKRGKYDANNKRISGEYDYTKVEYITELMREKDIDCYFIQETWWEGTEFDVIINGYHMFRHNDILENNLRKGVAIILSPQFYEG